MADSNTKQLDRKFFAREPGDVRYPEIVRSKGNYLYAADGKRYIDFLMGWCIGNLGWGNEVIEKAVRKYKGPAYVYPHLLYRPWAELAELLAQIAPGKLNKAYRTTGGTESVDAAMQIAMCYTGRTGFISIDGCYHGNSLAAISIGDKESRKPYKNLLSNCHTIAVPLDEKAAAKAEKLLSRKNIAAFIMEPVICNMGVIIPHPEFMQHLQAACRKYGTLLIVDEVATGFGRTGRLFASEHYGLVPDILCLGKAITGGYGGMGAVMTTTDISRSVKEDLSLYSTYGWHPLSVQAALANIRYLLAQQEKLMDHVQEMEIFFCDRIMQMGFRTAPEIHSAGLAIGVDVGDEKYAGKIMEKCLKNGLLLSTSGTRLTLFPALNINRKAAAEGLKILGQSVGLAVRT